MNRRRKGTGEPGLAAALAGALLPAAAGLPFPVRPPRCLPAISRCARALSRPELRRRGWLTRPGAERSGSVPVPRVVPSWAEGTGRDKQKRARWLPPERNARMRLWSCETAHLRAAGRKGGIAPSVNAHAGVSAYRLREAAKPRGPLRPPVPSLPEPWRSVSFPPQRRRRAPRLTMSECRLAESRPVP